MHILGFAVVQLFLGSIPISCCNALPTGSLSDGASLLQAKASAEPLPPSSSAAESGSVHLAQESLPTSETGTRVNAHPVPDMQLLRLAPDAEGPNSTDKLRAVHSDFAGRPPRRRVEEPLIFTNGEKGYYVFRTPAILRIGRGLLAFAEGRESCSDGGHIDLVMKRSWNGGRTWGPIQVLATGGKGDTHGNPVPVYDTVNHTVILVWTVNNTDVFVQASQDEGKTWGQKRNITTQVKLPGWGWMATGPVHGTQLQSGRLVIPFNSFLEEAVVSVRSRQRGCADIEECARSRSEKTRSLVTEVKIINPRDTAHRVLRTTLNGTSVVPPYTWAGDRAGIFFSDDHGETWHLGGMVDSRIGSSECVAAETSAGLLLSFRVEDPDTRCRKMALSHDGGMTFQPFFEPGECIPDPTCQGSMVRLEDGRVVTSGPGSKRGRTHLSLHVGNTTEDDGTGPFDFQAVGHVSDGASGYSDLVEVGKTWRGAASKVGVLYEGNGGLIWKTADVPALRRTKNRSRLAVEEDAEVSGTVAAAQAWLHVGKESFERKQRRHCA
mmetsp:Transcript_56839/g.161311  ORF Transcript_56839/g.161311 Transcript_56839/m.161311 type:complete len:550 (+) Transcript_56839:149-1798(+)